LNFAGKPGSHADFGASAHGHTDSLSKGADTVTVPDAHLLFSGDYARSGADLIISDHVHRVVVPNYFNGDKRPALVSAQGAPLDPKFVDALTGHVQYAQAGAAAAAKVVGHVVKMTGSASIVRNGVTIDVNNGDNVYQNDAVQTGSGSTLGLVMIDGTTFNLTANARLMMNDLTYDATSTSNTSLFTLVQGAATFVAGQVAKTGDMKVSTPVATMGIRGTAVILDISATDGTVLVSVANQRDGQIHAVQVFNARGDLIGTVTSNGSSLTLTPTATFEVIAQESNKTVAQVLTEFNAFQLLLSTYEIGKQLFPNTPFPTDGRRGDNTQQPLTKFAGSTISPIDSTSTKFNADIGGTKDAKIDTGTGDAATLKPTGDGTGLVTKVAVNVGDAPVQFVGVAATSIPFVVTPSPVSRISSGPGDHFGPVMSADGQFVTYDPDGAIYLFDRQTGTTKTVAAPGGGLTYGSPTISSDGHFIVYQGSDGTQSWIFIYNNDASDPAHFGQTTRLMSGGQAAISGDGSKLVVERGGSIGLYDQQGHELASFTAPAIGTTGTLWKPAISADGHIIAFWSSDLSSPGGAGQLFTYNLSTATISSIASTARDAGNSAASFSADGHYVAYQSDAPGGHSEIYLYDLRAEQVVFHTANPDPSYNPVLSPDGHFIILASDARLTADDRNSVTDIYVIDVSDPSKPVYKLVSALDDGTQGDDASNLGAAISAGGQFIAFGSRASNFSTGDTPGSGDIFVVDPTSGHSAIILESRNSPAVLTTSGVIKLTGEHSGITLGVSDSRITASFDSHGDIQWSFSEPRSDFALLQPGQISVQNFVITLSTDRSTTEIPVKVSIYDVDQPAVSVADAAPVASPVTLAAGTEDVSYTISSAALLAGVVDIDGPSLSINAVGILSGGGAIVDNHNGTFSYTPAPNYNGPVVFSYTASDGTLSASSTATLNIAAVNDAPTVSSAVTGGGAEGSGVATVNLLNFASDADAGAVLHVQNLVWTDTGSGFPAGVTLSADGHSLLVDTNNVAYDHLAQGASFTAHFSYDVVDEHGALVHQTASVTIGGSNDAPVILQTAGLLGIGFNSSIQQNFIAAIEPGSGAITTLSNFAFDSGFWNPVTLTASGNDLYALSSGLNGNGSLYDFDAMTGALKSVVAAGVQFQALRAESNGTVIGIGFNASIGQNFIATIDPNSGAVTTLNNFAFDSGFWDPSSLTVAGNDLYAMSSPLSGNGSLYDFDATTGALKSVVSLSVQFQALRAEPNGTLIGIGYNASIGQNFVATLDPASGAVTTLNSFTFDSGFWVPVSLTISGNDLYALSSPGPAVNGSLYDFDATTGVLKSVVPAGVQFQALVGAGHGSGAASGSGKEGSGTFNVNLLQNAFDVDDGAVLHVANLVRTDGGGMPAGFALGPDGNSIAVDTDSPVYNSLAPGQTFTAHFGYDVVDEHGASVHQTATVTIAGTNDAPALTRAALTIGEGATVVLAAADIGVTDPDSTRFTFTVSGVSHGTFQTTVDGIHWAAATTFTTADLNAGHVRFVHDGGEDAPTFSIQANDGAGSNSLSNVLAGSVTFTNANDAPVITNAVLTISEGGTLVLTSANIGVSDPDSTSFTFTASGVTHGTFQTTTDGAHWAAATTFTTADLNAGHVRFVHDGGEDAPAFSIQANDGAGSNSLSNVLAGSVNFTNVNDAPVIDSRPISEIAVVNSGDILAFTGQLVGRSIGILSGDGHGGFTPVVVVGASNSFKPLEAALGDVNSDGIPDLVVRDDSVLSIHMADGAGGFSPAVSIATGISAFQLIDINGDGSLDIITSDLGGKTGVLAGDGHGGFSPVTAGANLPGPGFQTADVNGDGFLDSVSGNNSTVSVQLGDGHGGFSSPATFANGIDASHLALGDVNGDGAVDIVTVSGTFDPITFQLGAKVSVLFGDGRGSFSTPAFLNPGGINPTAIALADLNHDGAADIITADPTRSRISIISSDGHGGFLQPVALTDGLSGPNSVAVADVTGEGILDIIVTDDHGNIDLIAGDGHGGFLPTVKFPSGGNIPAAIDVVEVSGAGPLHYIENQSPRRIDPGLTISDADSQNIVSATVSIANNFHAAEDSLGFTDQNGIHGSYNSATGVLTLSGVSSVANYQAALRSVTYFNGSDDPSGATRTVSYQVDDGSSQNHSSDIFTASIDVIPADDAPTITRASLTISQGHTVTVTTADIDFVDPDSPVVTYTVSNLSHGHFETGVGNDAIETETFTSADVAAGLVSFVDDGSSGTPTFSLTPNDGTVSGAPVNGAVTFEAANYTLTSTAGLSIHVTPEGATSGFTFPGAGNVTTPGIPEDRIAIGYDVGRSHVVLDNAPLLGVHQMGPISSETHSSGGTTFVSTTLDAGHDVTLVQTLALGSDANFFTTTIDITNNGATDISNLRFLRNFDPDQDVQAHNDYKTFNEVVQNPDGAETFAILSATGVESHTKVAMIGLGAEWRASVFGFTNTDPYSPHAFDAPTVPNKLVAQDLSLSLTSSLGTLTANGGHAEVTYITTNNVATSGSNALYGTAGADTINGLGGDDLLIGLKGADTFVFNAAASGGSGHDTIADFTPGQDQISLDYHAFDAAAGPNDFSNWLRTHATDINNINNTNDVLIDLNVDGLHPGVDTILLKNVASASLQAGDFHTL
jgi:VCBS repeat-containing protein